MDARCPRNEKIGDDFEIHNFPNSFNASRPTDEPDEAAAAWLLNQKHYLASTFREKQKKN